MRIEAREGPRGAVVALQGSFDPAAADLLHEALLELEPGRPVTVDFREVRLFHDSAVAKLARELSGEPGRRVALLGLSEHHRRLLRYCGASDDYLRH